MIWKEFSKEKPKHKNLVLCWNGEISIPAIYYDNADFCGFYYYTTYFHSNVPTIYSKVKLKSRHQINNVLMWRLIDKP